MPARSLNAARTTYRRFFGKPSTTTYTARFVAWLLLPYTLRRQRLDAVCRMRQHVTRPDAVDWRVSAWNLARRTSSNLPNATLM